MPRSTKSRDGQSLGEEIPADKLKELLFGEAVFQPLLPLGEELEPFNYAVHMAASPDPEHALKYGIAQLVP